MLLTFVVIEVLQDSLKYFRPVLLVALREQQAIADAVGIDKSTVNRILDDLLQNDDHSDLQLFHNFDERKIYTVWNFPKATNEVNHVGSILSLAEACATRFNSKLIQGCQGRAESKILTASVQHFQFANLQFDTVPDPQCRAPPRTGLFDRRNQMMNCSWRLSHKGEQ